MIEQNIERADTALPRKATKGRRKPPWQSAGMHLSEDMQAELRSRSEQGDTYSAVLRRLLVRMLDTLAQEREALTGILSKDEFIRLYQILHDRRFGPERYGESGYRHPIRSLQFLWAEVDAEKDKTAQALAAKLRAMPFSQILAAIDCIEQLRIQGVNPKHPGEDALKAVGLEWKS